jgi:hypothetical protein
MKLIFKISGKEIKISWLSYHNLLFFGIYTFAVFLNLKFRANIPAHAGFYSPHDDTLGVRVAKNILDGKWLGVWDNLILAKPPGYSIYLAFAQIFPIEIVVFNQVIVCVIAFIFSRLLYSIFLKHNKYGGVIAFFAFIYLIFNPYLFSVEMSRVYRSSAHAIFILGFLVLVFSLFNCIHRFQSDALTIGDFTIKIRLHTIGLALLYSLLILLRSESYWILVSTALIGSIFSYLSYLQIRKSKIKAKQFRKLAPSLLILATLTYLVPISLIGQINNVKYGSSLIENYYSGNFAKAIKDWQRVEEGKDPHPYIVVSNEQRSAVYKVSRNAALLKPYLELSAGEGWLGQACNSPLQLCDNAGPWFPWLLRDAVIATDLVKNEREFQEFFKQISLDIKDACTVGKLECGPIGLGVGAKPFSDLPFGEIYSYTVANSIYLLESTLAHNGSISTPDKFGAPADVLEMYHEVVNYDLESTKSGIIPGYSWSLDQLQRVFSWINMLVYLLAFLGFMLGWRHPKRKLVFGALALGLSSFALCVGGVSITQISFGMAKRGPYVLPLYPIIQFLTLVGLMTLMSYIVNFAYARRNEKSSRIKIKHK